MRSESFGARKERLVMIPQKKELCENITLYTVRTDKFKTGMLSVSVHMPRDPQTSVYNGIIAGIMRRGTERYPSISAINRALDKLYASTVEIKPTRYGENCVFSLSCELLDNSYAPDGTDIADGVLGVAAQILFAPLTDTDGAFPECSVEQEKKIAADALRAEINNPRAYATIRLNDSLERDNPRRATTRQSLEIIEASDRYTLTEHYRNNIANQALSIFYVGSLSADEIAERILRHFPSGRVGTAETVRSIAHTAPAEPIVLSEDMPVSQGKLAIGFRTGICIGDAQYYAAILMNEILGGSPASKLFMNVREKMSLCYYCSSSYNSYNGDLTVSSGIEVSDKDRALEAILRELDDIRIGNVSDAEITAAKKSLENAYRQIYDNPFDLYSFYSRRELLGLQESVENCRLRISEVTLEQVVAVARSLALDTVFFLRGTLSENEEEYDNE